MTWSIVLWPNVQENTSHSIFLCDIWLCRRPSRCPAQPRRGPRRPRRLRTSCREFCPVPLAKRCRPRVCPLPLRRSHAQPRRGQILRKYRHLGGNGRSSRQLRGISYRRLPRSERRVDRHLRSLPRALQQRHLRVGGGRLLRHLGRLAQLRRGHCSRRPEIFSRTSMSQSNSSRMSVIMP